MTQGTPQNARAIVRFVLLGTSVLTLVLAALVFARVLPLPMLVGYVFVIVAVTDLVMGLVVFKE